MRAPIVLFALAFGAGLSAGLVPFLAPRSVPLALVIGGAVGVAAWRCHAPAPRSALMLAVVTAGLFWGMAARREQSVTCVGQWTAEREARRNRALVVRLLDPVSSGGEVVGGDPLDATCEGEVPLRWPPDSVAQGGTTWLVSGPWLTEGDGDRGVFRVRRARLLDARPRRGAVAFATRSRGGSTRSSAAGRLLWTRW